MRDHPCDGNRAVSAPHPLWARAIEEDEIDMIGLARPFCTDIDIAERLLTGEVSEIKDWSDQIRIGRGLLSPTSPISFLRESKRLG